MALNWIEDIVSQFYKNKGYLVLENEDLPMPRTEGRTVRGHSDIDVLAIGKDEILHIECQSWWGPSRLEEENELNRLLNRFKHSPELLKEKFPFLLKEEVPKRIFITTGKPVKSSQRGGPWKRLEEFCKENDIKLIEVNCIIEEYIELLRIKYPNKSRVGKEPPLSRFLLHLILNDFIKDKMLREHAEAEELPKT